MDFTITSQVKYDLWNQKRNIFTLYVQNLVVTFECSRILIIDIAIKLYLVIMRRICLGARVKLTCESKLKCCRKLKIVSKCDA